MADTFGMSFERVYSGAPWEKKVGYCRALRAGPNIHVTGTAPVDSDGSVHAPGDAYRQTRRCLEIIEDALSKLGVGMHDVVRTRLFVTDISRWAEYGRAHGEVFELHHPTTTMVEVRGLIDPQMLVEIEADAWGGPAAS
jgi:isochorismate pyruvate lyase